MRRYRLLQMQHSTVRRLSDDCSGFRSGLGRRGYVPPPVRPVSQRRCTAGPGLAASPQVRRATPPPPSAWPLYRREVSSTVSMPTPPERGGTGSGSFGGLTTPTTGEHVALRCIQQDCLRTQSAGRPRQRPELDAVGVRHLPLHPLRRRHQYGQEWPRAQQMEEGILGPWYQEQLTPRPIRQARIDQGELHPALVVREGAQEAHDDGPDSDGAAPPLHRVRRDLALQRADRGDRESRGWTQAPADIAAGRQAQCSEEEHGP